MQPEDEQDSTSISGRAKICRVIGFLIFTIAWFWLALIAAGIGGRLSGLRDGGWNWQYLALVPAALVAPFVGSLAAYVRSAGGRSFWESLADASMAVPILAFLYGFIYYAIMP